MRKSSTEAENKYMVRTWWVTLTAQNTCEFGKNQAYLYIYAKYIHNSICIYVHIGTTVHMYMQPRHNCPLGASKIMLQLCKTYNSVFDYPGEMGERSKLMPKQLKPSRGFIHRAMRAQPLNAPSSFLGLKIPPKSVG